MTGLIEAGKLVAATDETMAYSINRPSASRTAVDGRVRGVATDIISNDTTVKDAAAAAVGDAANTAGFLTQQQLGAVRTLSVDDPTYSEVRLSRDFRRVGGTLVNGGEVSAAPGTVTTATPAGSGTVLLSRDYRRTQPGAGAGGVTPQSVLAEWAGRLPGLGFGTLAGWGDSMMTDFGAAGDAQVALVADLLNVEVLDGGVSGQSPTEVAFRAGVLDVRLGAIEIPPAGAVPANVTPGSGWWNWKVIPGRVLTMAGEYARVILRHSAAGPETAAAFTIEQVNGTGPIKLLPGTRVSPETLPASLLHPALYWVGRNDPDVERVRSSVLAFTGRHRDPGRRRLVLPLFNRQNSPAGSPSYVRDMAVNEAVAESAGVDFFDSRRLLIDHGLEILGINPTPEDIAAQAEDRIPDTLMLDVTHLTPTGRLAHAIIIATEIVGRNW